METTVLFRPSEISNLMANPRGKSNLEKYTEMVDTREAKLQEYDDLKNKETKKAQAILDRIEKLNKQIQDLEPMKDLPNLSEGTKTHLRKKMIEIRYKRYKDVESKQMTKGKVLEEKAIDLYSLIKGMVFENNKIRTKNEYYSGEIDLPWYTKKTMTAISDIKNSWDVFTFWDNENSIKSANKWQGVAYMDLHPTVQEYHIANILLDNTHDAILQELYRESYKWKDGETPTWRELQIIKSHTYTKSDFDNFINLRGCAPITDQDQEVYDSFIEIPMNEERLIEHTFTRDEVEQDILDARKRMDECRLYLEMIYNIKHIPADAETGEK